MSGTEDKELERDDREDVVAEPEGQAEPSNLAEAFAQYRARNQEAAEPPVPPAEGAGDGGTYDADGGAAEPAGGPDLGVEPAAAPGDDGGLADVGSPDDYVAYRNGLMQEIQRASYDKVAQEFQKQGIQKLSVSQLYQRDEDRGIATFLNPDDPNHPFESRAAAQAFCEAFNKDIDMEFRKATQAEYGRLMNQYRPTMELIDFAPKFESFSQTKQDIIDDLIEPYEIKSNTGKIIGYRCNLDAAAAQADKILARFPQPKAEEPAQEKAGSEPALDMKSHGAGGGGKAKEPKTLEEAMRMVQQEKGNR